MARWVFPLLALLAPPGGIPDAFGRALEAMVAAARVHEHCRFTDLPRTTPPRVLREP